WALIMLKVKATSLALNGFPSFHLTPARTGIVSVLPPLEKVGWPDASIGIPGSVGFRLFQMYSGSLYRATALVRKPVEVDESGLKLSVIGDSGVLSMTSGWPVLAAGGVLDELEPPQAATPRARTPAAATLFKIVCLIA